MYIVTEILRGGELLDALLEKRAAIPFCPPHPTHPTRSVVIGIRVPAAYGERGGSQGGESGK